jgi:DNA topoisomerase-1
LLTEIKTEEKQTEPPDRYTEAGLVKELEARGIGRPSTYASIIKTIEERGYVEKEGRSLKPTDTGDVVSTFLENNFADYISDTFTAEIEDKLDLIAEGKTEYEKTLSTFYKPFLKEVKAKDKSAEKLTTLGDADPKFKCPKCGSSMVIKLGRAGRFLSCSKYPDCDGALMIDGTEVPKDKILGKYTGTDLDITVKNGRFGPYVQVGEKTKANPKPRRSSIPKGKDPNEVTIEDAHTYLALPRLLGNHPDTGEPITASVGRFGPYIVLGKDFRSLKTDNVYTIELPRALEIFKEPKRPKGFLKKKPADSK